MRTGHKVRHRRKRRVFKSMERGDFRGASGSRVNAPLVSPSVADRKRTRCAILSGRFDAV